MSTVNTLLLIFLIFVGILLVLKELERVHRKLDDLKRKLEEK